MERVRAQRREAVDQLRIAATNFLTRVWNDGALFGSTPSQAFYVKCDSETNPPEVMEAGQVICEIGIAPVKPAEFVVFRLSQFGETASWSSWRSRRKDDRDAGQ